MSNLEMKNIVDVDVITEASGNENLLVESNGLLKRLPSNNFSSGGSGGGSGAGFDLVCRKATIYSTASGGDIVELADNEIVIGEDFDITFDAFFPETDGPYDTNNVYKRFSTLMGTAYEVFGYYSNNNNEWALALPSVGEAEEEFNSVIIGQEIIQTTSNITFAELDAIRRERPISVLFEKPNVFGEVFSGYYYVISDYSAYSAMLSQSSDEDLAEMGLTPAVKNGTIILALSLLGTHERENEETGKSEIATFNLWPTPALILFENGTLENPELGIAFVEEFEGK